MEFENESLEMLFDHWNELLKTTPSEAEREQLKRIPLYTFADKDYSQKQNDPEYFSRWMEHLPAYYQRKARLMLAILTRLEADSPMMWVRSEIREDIPQLSYFMFLRHLELFVIKDPLELASIKSTGPNQWKPEWLGDLIPDGVSLEEILALTQMVAQQVVWRILAVTDGYGAYGDLPENAPRPQIIATPIEPGQSPRYLSAIHEYIEESVLRPPGNE